MEEKPDNQINYAQKSAFELLFKDELKKAEIENDEKRLKLIKEIIRKLEKIKPIK